MIAEIISFDKFNIVFKKVSEASCFVIGDYEENELVRPNSIIWLI